MRTLIQAAAAAAFGAALVIGGAACGIFGLTLRAEVRPIEVVSLFASLLIAFFLQRFIVTRINDLRAEKNVLISATEAIIEIANEVRENVSSLKAPLPAPTAEMSKIVSGFRRLANAVTDLDNCIKLSKLQSLRKSTAKLRDSLHELKMVATGGSFQTKGYTIEEWNAQDRLFREITLYCRELIFEINRAQG